MIRLSEMVLPGHPDKFCDQIADAIVAAAVAIEDDAYAQVEVSVWSDSVWLSGGICTRSPLGSRLEDIVVETGLSIGNVPGSHIDSNRYRIVNTVCQQVGDPSQWSRYVNDQCIAIGWAGYDALTHYLPPEHYAAHCFRRELAAACHSGQLKGHGPDGKLLVRVREEGDKWILEHVLITIQQRECTDFLSFCAAVASCAEKTYQGIRERDRRWRSAWDDVEVMVNPNGPLLNGGSDGDNGQTGRKLVVDYYGPRIPIGGGALSGKHLGHIDRVAAYAARKAAIDAVSSGAKECQVRLTYAPNIPEPLDISYEMVGKGIRRLRSAFHHLAMLDEFASSSITRELGRGEHFFDLSLPWNHVGK